MPSRVQHFRPFLNPWLVPRLAMRLPPTDVAFPCTALPIRAGQAWLRAVVRGRVPRET